MQQMLLINTIKIVIKSLSDSFTDFYRNCIIQNQGLKKHSIDFIVFDDKLELKNS